MSDAALRERPVTESTDLIIPLPKQMTAETFTDEDQFEDLYRKVKDAVSSHEPDLTTKGGRDAIASLAYKVARTKTALIKQGKALTEDWRQQTKKVNAACNTIEERLDALKEDVRRPLTEWEDAEKARTQKHEDGIARLSEYEHMAMGLPSGELKALLTEVEATPTGNVWEEYESRAQVAKEYAVANLKRLIEQTEKQEADAAELERLRAEKAEREAAEQARLEEERRKVEQERLEREARERAEREAQEKVAAAERAAKEAEERAKREIEEAKARAECEAEAERKRLADEKAAEEAEQRRRDDDREHRRKVNNAIVAELVECSGIADAKAQKIVAHIAGGFVPNVTLKY